MTGYTRNRAYPFPSSERETGRGGTHSEALARAVASDLDVLDAAWAGEQAKLTAILSLGSDQTGIPANTEFGVSFSAAEKTPNSAFMAIGQAVFCKAAGAGWYHVTGCTRAGASGTITANARHRMSLATYQFKYGNVSDIDVRYSETYQAGSQDCYNTLDAIMFLDATRTLEMRYLHSNTGSNVSVKAGMTRLACTRLMGA
jgi:hypothetical protein